MYIIIFPGTTSRFVQQPFNFVAAIQLHVCKGCCVTETAGAPSSGATWRRSPQPSLVVRPSPTFLSQGHPHKLLYFSLLFSSLLSSHRSPLFLRYNSLIWRHLACNADGFSRFLQPTLVLLHLGTVRTRAARRNLVK